MKNCKGDHVIELVPISSTTLWILVSAGSQPAHFSNDEDEWQCVDCQKWRPRGRFLVYAPDEATDQLKETWICNYCAQERVINWVDPLVLSRLKRSLGNPKNVTTNAHFSTAKLRRVTYNNGDTVDELVLRLAPEGADESKRNLGGDNQ